MIENRLLYYFLAVAREESISKAAESLHISQSTLSKQMIDFEEYLGKKLFIRGSKKISLTDDGIYLRTHAQEIISLVEKTESAFHEDEYNIEGDIYLGCGETPVMNDIIKIYKDIIRDYPGIKLHLISDNADSIINGLDKGLLDIGILIGPVKYDKYNYLPLHKRHRFGILMPRESPLAQKNILTEDDLQGIPFIIPSQTGTITPEFNSNKIVATYNLIYNATFMVEQGVGYALCLDHLVPLDNRNLIFKPFSPTISAEIYLVTKKYQSFNKAINLFLERLNHAAIIKLNKIS